MDYTGRMQSMTSMIFVHDISSEAIFRYLFVIASNKSHLINQIYTFYHVESLTLTRDITSIVLIRLGGIPHFTSHFCEVELGTKPKF